jgi:hypothetical protein
MPAFPPEPRREKRREPFCGLSHSSLDCVTFSAQAWDIPDPFAILDSKMQNTLDMKRPDQGPEAAIDTAVLDQILAIGDAGMRGALLEQLLIDFNRIGEALADASRGDVGAAAHELKGLAATIGAHRLAQLATRLNTVADCAVPAELGEFSAPVRGEIRVVLESLARHAGRVRP